MTALCRAAVICLLAATAFGVACTGSSSRSSAVPATLVVAQGGDPGAMNPAVTTSGNTHPVTDQIFNGLVGLDEQFNPVPELAERWSVEDEGRTYRFFLRQDVRWHDGTPFTSADVKFTFQEALLKYHSRTRAALEGLIDAIDIPDDHTVIFRLERPYSPLLQRLDVVEASIIPRHMYAGQDLLTGEATRRPIGTGPFQFVSYAPGDKVILERNRRYFREGRPGVDRLIFRIFQNPSTSVSALEAGEVDYVGAVPGPDTARLRRTPGIAVVAGSGGPGGSVCQDVLIPNLTRPPFNDVHVRRAVAHAIDKRFIVDRVYFGQGQPATGPISHALPWAYTPDVRQYPLRSRTCCSPVCSMRPNQPPKTGGERFALTFTHVLQPPAARTGAARAAQSGGYHIEAANARFQRGGRTGIRAEVLRPGDGVVSATARIPTSASDAYTSHRISERSPSRTARATATPESISCSTRRRGSPTATAGGRPTLRFSAFLPARCRTSGSSTPRPCERIERHSQASGYGPARFPKR